MPANYAHYRFGKLALSKLPAEARQCIGRFRRLYDIGLHGPDIFFYYNPAIDTAVGQRSAVLLGGLQAGRFRGREGLSAGGSGALLPGFRLPSLCKPAGKHRGGTAHRH